MNQTASLLVGVALVLGVGSLVYWQTNMADTAAPQQTATTNTNQQGGNTAANEGIPADEVAQHKDSTSCWSMINGNVYDLTSWIPKHPGGPQAILQLCGTDGSAKFNGMHGGSAMQEQILAGFKIGVVRQ